MANQGRRSHLAANEIVAYVQSIVGDRYQVLTAIGQGGNAYVCRARDNRRDSVVAVKVLRPEVIDRGGRERMIREIRVGQALAHPHVLPVLDADAAASLPWMATPVAEDGNVARLIRESPFGVPLGIGVKAIRSTASALLATHAAGYIHRDTTPENILASSGEFWLSDFGAVRRLDEAETDKEGALTPAGQTLGRPEYMSPEQLIGGPLDQRADIYSLGVVAYQILTGHLPIVTNDVTAYAALKARGEIQRADAVRPAIPQRLADLIHQCLEGGRAERPPSAGQVVQTLDELNQAGLLSLRGDRQRIPNRSSLFGWIRGLLVGASGAGRTD